MRPYASWTHSIPLFAASHRGAYAADDMPSGKRHMTTTSRGCGAGYDCQLLHRICPLLAQSGHHAAEFQCLLLGVKRTSSQLTSMSVIDPKRTLTTASSGGLLPRP